MTPAEMPAPYSGPPLTVAYLGNFRHSFCTEVHVAASLESLGHTVVRLQEDETAWRTIPATVQAKGAQLFMWTRTWPSEKSAALPVLDELRSLGVPSAFFHLDRWHGLDREHQVKDQPFAYCDVVFSPNDSPKWKEEGFNHFWLPPGVYGPECEPVPPNPRRWPFDVVFVGSHPYPHPEWAKYRTDLLSAFRAAFGRRFAILPRERRGTPIRGRDLQELYATVPVVLGDSCLAGESHRYWCVDEDTEALTADGWKRCDDIHAGDLLYTLNPDSGLGEWQPARHVSVWPAEQRTMFAMEGERHSSLTTPNHRWFIERHVNRRTEWGPSVCPECGRVGGGSDPRWGTAIHRRHMHGVEAGPPKRTVEYRRMFATSEELQQGDRIPLCAPCADLPVEPKYSDALVELVGWLWTEGHWSIDRYKGVTQSHRVNGPYVARIRACLTSLFGAPLVPLGNGPGRVVPAWREQRDDARGMTVFLLNAAAGRSLAEFAPSHVVTNGFVMSLTRSQLSLFVETSVDADGCRKTSTVRGCTSTSVTLSQKEGRRLDPFEMACALLGKATSRTRQRDMWLVHVKTRMFTAPLRKNQGVVAERRPYEGVVWCPTTENGTWLARRRGTVYFTGNSDRVPETLGRGGLLIHPVIEGIEQWYGIGRDFIGYTLGDFSSAVAHARWALDYPEQPSRIRDRGRATVLARDTYAHRMGTVLAVAEGIYGGFRDAQTPPSRSQGALLDSTPEEAERVSTNVHPPSPSLRVNLNRWSAVFEPRPGTTDAEVIGEVWTCNDYRVPPHGFRGTVVDIGANVGAFSVLAAKAGARVIAVEPEPQNRARLLHHLALNRVVDRVEVLTEAITDRTGDRLRIADTGGGAHLDVDGVEVYSLSFADLIAKYAPVYLVKFDAEMAEWLAFESVTAEYLRANVKRISLEWHSPIVMPHLQHLDDGRHMERWSSLVAKLADCGRLEIFGHPERGGLLWWSSF